MLWILASLWGVAPVASAWERIEPPCSPGHVLAGVETWFACRGSLWRWDAGRWDPAPLPTRCGDRCFVRATLDGPLWAAEEGLGTSIRLPDGTWTPWAVADPAITRIAVSAAGTWAAAVTLSPEVLLYDEGTWRRRRVAARQVLRVCAGRQTAWGIVDQDGDGGRLVQVWPPDAIGAVLEAPAAGIFGCRVGPDDVLRVSTPDGATHIPVAGSWQRISPEGTFGEGQSYAGGDVWVGGAQAWRKPLGAPSVSLPLPCEAQVAVSRDGWLRARCDDALYLEEGGGPLEVRARRLAALPPALHEGWGADVDGDGLEDAIVQVEEGEASIWLQRAGTFVPAGPAWALPKGRPILSVEAADLDSDGDGELLILRNGGAVSLFRSWGAWLEEVALPESQRAQRGRARPQLADADGDGDLDLLIPSGTRRDLRSYSLVWRERRWPPSWPERTSPAFLGPGYTRRLVRADLDEDGREDAIEINGWKASLRLVEDWTGHPRDRSDGSGLEGWFSDPTGAWLTEVGGARTLVVTYGRRGPRTFRHLGGFSFEDATAVDGLLAVHDRPAWTAVMVDVDGDGDDDLVQCPSGGRCVALANSPGGLRVPSWPLPEGTARVWSIDLGGDGHEDVVFGTDEGAVVWERAGAPPPAKARVPVGVESPRARVWWHPAGEVALLGVLLLPALSLGGLRHDRAAWMRAVPPAVALLGLVAWSALPVLGPHHRSWGMMLAGTTGLLAVLESWRRAQRSRTLLGRYRLEASRGWSALAAPPVPLETTRVLGRGGGGLVLAATDVHLGRPVAVKVLRPRSREAARVLSAVGQRLEGVSSPHLVPLLDLHVTPQRAWVVMGLVEGVSLAEIVARGPVDVGPSLRILHDVLIGLTSLHDAGVVHGDVSLRNVIVTAAGRAVLVDLGLATTPGEEVLGFTPGFAGPEVVPGARSDPRGDVYAAGALWWSLRTGRVPQPGTDLRLSDAPPPLQAATDPDPEGRPGTAGALRAALPVSAVGRERVAALLSRPGVAPPRLTETRTWPL